MCALAEAILLLQYNIHAIHMAAHRKALVMKFVPTCSTSTGSAAVLKQSLDDDIVSSWVLGCI